MAYGHIPLGVNLSVRLDVDKPKRELKAAEAFSLGIVSTSWWSEDLKRWIKD